MVHYEYVSIIKNKSGNEFKINILVIAEKIPPHPFIVIKYIS